MNGAVVKAFDYLRGYHQLREEIDRAIHLVLESGRLILGPEVEAFQHEFARYVGTTHGVGVGCGTEAITLALAALDIGPGDEVITVANAGVPTVSAIRQVGATPRFVDVRPDTLLIDPELAEAAIGPRTRALLPVHLYGMAAPLEPLTIICRRHGLALIEDCAQAHGTRYADRHVGSFGHIGCFSFYPTKNLGALGDAGMCVTSDMQLAARLRMLRNHGWGPDRVAECEGRNTRLDELQAAVLRVRLRHLNDALRQRRSVAEQYTAALSTSSYHLPLHAAGPAQHSFHLYVIRTRHRRELLDVLRQARIGFGLHYPEAVHLMPAYEPLGYRCGQLPVTERTVQQVVSLPMFPELRAEEIQRVVAAMASAERQSPTDPATGTVYGDVLEGDHHDAA